MNTPRAAVLFGVLLFSAAALWVLLPRAAEEPSLMTPLTEAIPLEPLMYDVKIDSSGTIVALAGSLGFEGRVQVFSYGDGLREIYAEDLAVDFPQCCTNPPLVLSQDGRLMIGGSVKLVMWSAAATANISQQALDGKTPVDLALDEAGRILAAVSSDRKLHIFDLTEGRRLWSVTLGEGWWADVDVTPQGRIALNSGSRLKVFDSASPEPLGAWPLEAGYVVSAVAISPDGTVLGASEGAYQQGRLVYVRVGQKDPLWTYPLGKGGYPLLAIPPGGGLVAIEQGEGLFLALGSDGAPRWRVELGEGVRDAEFLADGGTVIALEERVLVVRDGETTARLQVEGRPIAVSSNGRTLALVYTLDAGFRSARYLRLYSIQGEDTEPLRNSGVSQAHVRLDLPTSRYEGPFHLRTQ